jgi:hypothetical protein
MIYLQLQTNEPAFDDDTKPTTNVRTITVLQYTRLIKQPL